MRHWIWLVFALAICLRVVSLGWNDRLQGDVNLFALSARELASTGSLAYPMRYDYSARVDYHTLTTPASQHPPVWAFATAVLARVLRTEDTFGVLKGLSFLCGLGLMWLV